MPRAGTPATFPAYRRQCVTLSIGNYYGIKAVVPRNSYVENLTPSVMVSGDGAFGGGHRSRGWSPRDRFSAVYLFPLVDGTGGHLQTRMRVLSRLGPSECRPQARSHRPARNTDWGSVAAVVPTDGHRNTPK